MPANVYECMFLLDTNKVQGDVNAAAQQLHTILEDNEAEVLASRPWDERRLAYPIKNHKKGLYYLTYFRCEGSKIREIESVCKLKDMIVRLLVVKIDPKLVEPMLDMARDEHAVALQTVMEDDSFGSMGGGGNTGRSYRDSKEAKETKETKEAKEAKDEKESDAKPTGEAVEETVEKKQEPQPETTS